MISVKENEEALDLGDLSPWLERILGGAYH